MLFRLALFVAICLAGTSFLVGAADKSTHPFTFVEVDKNERRVISIDMSRLKVELDEDGDTVAATYAQVTYLTNNPLGIKNYISHVQAMCGFDGIVVTMALGFDESGKVVHTEPRPSAVMKERSETAPVNVIYRELCKAAGTDKPGYKSQRRNNNLWV